MSNVNLDKQIRRLSMLVSELKGVVREIERFVPTRSYLEGRVYWFKKPKGEKDILIFHRGYVGISGEPIGDIHIYEHKETFKATELPNQLKKYGHYISWKIEDIG